MPLEIRFGDVFEVSGESNTYHVITDVGSESDSPYFSDRLIYGMDTPNERLSESSSSELAFVGKIVGRWNLERILVGARKGHLYFYERYTEDSLEQLLAPIIKASSRLSRIIV